MRFLLHSTTQRASSHGLRQGRKPSKKNGDKRLPASSVLVSKQVGTPRTTDAISTHVVQSWGQQCSPSCGCVVRFEATVDPDTNQFTSASYHAKSVIVTRNAHSNKMEPALTLRHNRPMFRSCNCKSLHKLASRVAEYLPNRNVIAFGSTMEFAGVRSSPAFRHTVLEKQGLNSADTHCFDVVEEALTAMVKGHMPKHREQITMKEIYAKRMELELELSSSASASAAAGTASTNRELGQERGQASSSSSSMGGSRGGEEDITLRIDMSSILAAPRAMSALKLLDVKADYSPFSFDKDGGASESGDSSSARRYNSNNNKRKEKEQSSSKNLDWVTYVDELYEKNNEASA